LKIGYIDFDVGKTILQTAVLGYLFIYVPIKHYSGDDRQLSPLKSTLGIPYLIWEFLRLLLNTSTYMRLELSTTSDLKL